MTDLESSATANVFESFNARTLAPEQVARTFIPPAFFDELVGRSHSVVVGPRGSGKTSLLKMLQPRALETWSSPLADSYRTRIDYTGVFIPTDVSWNRQTVALVSNLTSETATAFRTAAFTTHVLHKLVEVFTWRCARPGHNEDVGYRRVQLAEPQERIMAQQIADAWHLKPNTSSFLGIKHALAARHTEIWLLAQRASLAGVPLAELPQWMFLDFLSCSSFAVELFDDGIGDPQARWAFMFDELELAPQWVMQGLFAAIRSVQDKFLFKLALSPFNEALAVLKNASQAMPDQDYSEIQLWHAHKEQGMDFSRRLFQSVGAEFGGDVQSLFDLVGRSALEIEPGAEVPYGEGSTQHKILSRAIRQDPSFAKYWRDQGLDLDHLPDMDNTERAAKVRKVYPLVVIRDYFRSQPGTKHSAQQARRGRKSLQIYTGASSILAISEANPRWIIGLARLLFQARTASTRKVERHVQATLIERTIHKFRARLKALAAGGVGDGSRDGTLLGFIDKVGNHFRRTLILDDFRSQPPLSFTVDSNATDDVVAAIGKGLNSGAFVFVPDKGAAEGLLNDVKGKRFRLSYLLAPFYSLPLRLGESVSLNSILGAKPAISPMSPSPATTDHSQGELPFSTSD